MRNSSFQRWAIALWVLLIAAFGAVHFVHLQADFPNHSPWSFDYAKYTDEGWYGNAAIRQHLFGHWYVPGDFNPAPAVPVWPFLEWIVFSFTGVSVSASRALSVSFFLLEIVLGYLLLRARGSRWAALLALTLAVTSPFLYAFSRLAILEPLLVVLFLAALNLAVRLPRLRRPMLSSVAIGLLFTLMLLTKTTAVFLLPALGWAILLPLRADRRKALRCAAAAALTSAITFGGWMTLIAHAGLLTDYRYFFFVNKYVKPTEWYWPLLSLWWSLRGCLWADRLLVPAAALMTVVLALCWRWERARSLRRDPVWGASLLAIVGYVLFMTYQNHPQPRYYAVIAPFAFFVLAIGAEELMQVARHGTSRGTRREWSLAPGAAVVGACVVITAFNGFRILDYVAHPEYTFIEAARDLTQYMKRYPNGKPILLSVSGDEISLLTHVPALCDDFGTQDLPEKLTVYQPGWWATWNIVDPGTLEDLHTHYSLEQVARFTAFDDPDRNELVLFKLHPLPNGQEREGGPELQKSLPGDRIEIPVE